MQRYLKALSGQHRNPHFEAGFRNTSESRRRQARSRPFPLQESPPVLQPLLDEELWQRKSRRSSTVSSQNLINALSNFSRACGRVAPDFCAAAAGGKYFGRV